MEIAMNHESTLSDLQQEFDAGKVNKPGVPEAVCYDAALSHSAEVNEIATALAAAQGEIANATKDSSNPFFKSKYADLASVTGVIREAMSKNKIAWIQSPRSEGSLVWVDTMLAHGPSGQWIRGTLKMACTDSKPQSIGSGITYARRYSLQAMIGVAAEEDDDGNAASGNKTVPSKSPYDGGARR